MVDGQVSELIHKIIPAHPESEDRSVSCFLYLMSYRIALFKDLLFAILITRAGYATAQLPPPPFLLAKEGSIREVA